MFLKKLAIINYKSCRDLILNFSDNLPNTFIGRTDSGKTTILKAVGFLLGEKIPPNLTTEGQISSDISTTIIDIKEYDDIFKKLDLPVFPKEDAFSIIIIGIFNKQEGDFEGSFNDIASNHLKWSIDSNPKDEFPILIQFNKSNKSGRYFICALDKKDEKLELWNQNQNTLKEHRKKFNVSEEDINNINQAGRFKNIEVFKAIYNKIDTSIQWSEYDGFNKKDRSVFPSFKYIDWQTITLKGIEELANAALSSVLEEYDKRLAEEASRISSEATNRINLELKSKFDIIRADLASINSINARVFYETKPHVSEITVEKETSDGFVKLESQGDGIKKRIGFAFIRFAASENIDTTLNLKKHIWAFDEPEAHLYPPEKREFYELIKQLSRGVFQTFISTHSTVFVDKSRLDTIMQTQLEDKYTKLSTCSSVLDIHNSLGIKNSDFLFYDFFIVGEGTCEKILIPYFYELFFNRSVWEDSIQVIDLGGESFWTENKKLFEQILTNFKDPKECVFYLLDRDTNTQGSNVFLVGKYSIEDSIDDSYWIKLVDDHCGVKLTQEDLYEIRNKLGPSAENKFEKLLRDKVFNTKSKKYHLPSKTSCAKYMRDYIKDASGIPKDIVKLFESIQRRQV
jgi:putative ATP-dependent endonuclease of the OLD family